MSTPSTSPSSPRDSRAGMPSPLATLVLGLRFLTELALIAAAAWAGAARTRSIPLAVALGVIAAVLVAAIWGLWIAPTSRRRLPDPARLIVELVLFGAAAAGLVLAARPVVGAVVGIAGVAIAVVVRFVPEQAPRRTADTAATPSADVGVEATAPVPERPPRETTPEGARDSADAVTRPPGDAAPLRRPRGRDRARPRN